VCKILLVDDDPQFHFITEKRLQAERISKDYRGYLDPAKALKDLMNKYFRSETLPEIILLDLNMPQISGWAFLDFINNMRVSRGEEPSVYIVSSSVDPGDKQKAGLYSCVKGFISKPITSYDFQLMGLSTSH
jgi:CheY-like chemotaxis protein